MKKFGKKFEEYQPVEVENVEISEKSAQVEDESEIFKKTSKKKERDPKLEKKLKEELSTPIIEVAPAANVYQIPPDQQDLADFVKKTFSWYNFYVVELGLNVAVGREYQVPELLFKVGLRCDKERINAVAYDIAPKDETKYTKLLSGKVKVNLGITTLLEFIPIPLGEKISNLLSIDINPWEFEWGISRYRIDAAGKMSYDIHWKIYKTDMVQGFNPTMIIRAKKEVQKIDANVKCIYKVKTSWYHLTSEIKSKERKIPFWPV